MGTLYSGGEVNLDVTLTVPTELSNEFKNQIGYLDWEFMVEEFPVDPDDPDPPLTGDPVNLPLLIGGLVGSAAMFMILLLWRRKRQEKTQ